MKTLGYTNFVLTVLAILLSLQLWMAWLASPVGVPPAAQAGVMLDAGAQRQEMIEQLKQVNKKVEDISGLLKSGQVRVKVEGLEKDGAKGG